MSNACAIPLSPIVYTSTLFGAFDEGNHAQENCRIGPTRAAGDDWDEGDEDELEHPGDEILDPEDPDWGFDNEETLPDHGDFWLDSDEEEEPL